MEKNVLIAPVRWTGSKKKLLNEMIIMFDRSKKNYIEPFLGSGIVLLNVIQFEIFDNYFVNDVNENLINFYSLLKTDAKELIAKIKTITKEYNYLKNNVDKEKYYYYKRKQFNEKRIGLKTRSAIFWYLMKTGYNGVYRVNSKNEFNVPFGKKYIIVFDYTYFLNLSGKIKNVHFYSLDYKSFLDELGKVIDKTDCFLYCDPPYIPETELTRHQILYTANRFCHEEFLIYLKKII